MRRTDVIIVGVDGTAESLRACDFAFDRVVRRGGRLVLVHAYRPIVGEDADVFFGEPEMRQEGHRILREAAKHLQHLGASVEQIDLRLERGRMPTVVATASHGAMLVVIGRHDLTTAATAGSKAVGIAIASDCPLVVVPPHYEGRQAGPVAVGADADGVADAAVRFAFEEASDRETRLVAFHAWQLESRALSAETEAVWREQLTNHAYRLVRDVTDRFRDEFPKVEVDIVVADTPVREALLDQTADAQLLVVGTTGEGSSRSVGSIAQFAIAAAAVPVVVVRQR